MEASGKMICAVPWKSLKTIHEEVQNVRLRKAAFEVVVSSLPCQKRQKLLEHSINDGNIA